MRFLVFLAVALVAAWGCSADEPVVSDETSETSETSDSELLALAFDSPPKPIKTVEPTYPNDARRALAVGTAYVEVTIDESGMVQEATISKSSDHPSLDEAARDAAGKWLFEPAQLNGEPVLASVVIPFEFKLE